MKECQSDTCSMWQTGYDQGYEDAAFKCRKPVESLTPFCLDICKHYEKPSENERRVRNRRQSFGRYEPASKKPEPAKKKPGKLATPNTERYLKLHNGDVYDVDSNSILNRLTLTDILSA